MKLAELNQLKALVNSIQPEAEKPVVVPYSDSPTLLTRLVGDSSSWRLSRTPTMVKFGCGAVRVRKSDLQTLADWKELEPQFKALQTKFNRVNKKKAGAVARLAKAWQNSHHRASTKVVEQIPVEVLKGLIG